MRRVAAITLLFCWGLLQAEVVLASLAGCARAADGTVDGQENGQENAPVEMAADPGAELMPAIHAMDAAMTVPSAPCHAGGHDSGAMTMGPAPLDTTSPEPGCIACDLNCGALYLLEPALQTSQIRPPAATPACEGDYGPRVGSLFPALRPPIV